MGFRDETAGTSIDVARDQLGDRPRRATSEGRLWQGIWLDEYGPFHAVGAEPMPPRDHHVVVIARDHSPYVFQQRLGQTFKSSCRPGEISIIPAGHETIFRGLLPSHLRIGLSVDRLAEVADEFRRIGTYVRPQLANGFRVQDQFLDRLGTIFSAELLRPPHPAQDLMMESLAMTLSAHLLRGYGAMNEAFDGCGAATNIAAIRRALDCIKQPLDTRISLAELADASGISRFHLTRVFKRHFGLSPMAYLERTRIERAKNLIQRAEMSLAEIAQTVGFADQSHFTRRFKHHAGYTPGAYAREHARKRLPL
jgi:AraC family transcriptional regulator